MMQIAVGIPIWGAAMDTPGLGDMLEASCEEGVDGIWVGDHVALGGFEDSPYPYKNGGRFFLSAEDAWYEAFVCLGYIAARVGEVELGTGVALPLLRPPALLAKQAATVARLARGDFVLGVGAGWLRAEFDAVGVPFSGRGRRLEDCVRVIREYWTGAPRAGQYGDYTIPEGIGSHPTPPSSVPVLFGGNSEVALARAARLGDGWLGAVHRWEESSEVMAGLVDRFASEWNLHRAAESSPILGTVQAMPQAVVRADDFAEQVHKKLTDYARMGLTKVIFNLNWDDLRQVREVISTIKNVRDSIPEATT